MVPNRNYMRTPSDAASTAARFGRDFKLAARLHAQGLKAFRGRAPVFLVDLASKGSLVEPQGLRLRHSKLFNTQAAVSAYEMHRDIDAFERVHKVDDVVHIVLRPPLDLSDKEKESEKKLLDKNGRCPITNLRAGQKAFNNSVQRAIAELERRKLLTPFLVGRHLKAFEGGAVFDLHVHVVGQLKPSDAWAARNFLDPIFGSERVWISSVMNPGEQRSFSRTSKYPVWRLANQDWNEVNDHNLKEFFEQASGLRSVEALGPFRNFRTAIGSISDATTYDDGDHGFDAEMFDDDVNNSSEPPEQLIETSAGVPRPDGVNNEDEKQDAAAADITNFLASDPVRKPVLYSTHFAWIGLTRRFVAQVGNYTTFEELQRHYDLDDAIAFARRHVDDTHAYLFEPVTHENTSDLTATVTETAEPVGQQSASTGSTTAEPVGQQSASTGTCPTTPKERLTTKDGRMGAGQVRLAVEDELSAPPLPGDAPAQDSGREPITMELNLARGGAAIASLRIALAPSLLASIGFGGSSIERHP